MNEWTADVDRRIWRAIDIAMNRNFLRAGDPVVILTGWKPGSGSTNTMRIVTAADVKDKDVLPPIVGISSIPSFASIESGIEPSDSSTSVPDDQNVRFF
ncbi:hypothetical protein SNE40_007264 [Patella caerulea]|uniref:Pyruvate kinase C-terminal domain-containing protein n=1 Tax=Patella caerulea TaxID=87958 RepID=A0AAN8JZD6_PATCE